jgi:hypothetical protein
VGRQYLPCLLLHNLHALHPAPRQQTQHTLEAGMAPQASRPRPPTRRGQEAVAAAAAGLAEELGSLPGTDVPDVCVRRNWQSEAGAGAWRARLTATRSPGCPRPTASGPVSPLVTPNWLPVRLWRLGKAPEVSVRVC